MPVIPHASSMFLTAEEASESPPGANGTFILGLIHIERYEITVGGAFRSLAWSLEMTILIGLEGLLEDLVRRAGAGVGERRVVLLHGHDGHDGLGIEKSLWI